MAKKNRKAKSSKVWIFFLVAILILALAGCSFFGIRDSFGDPIIKGASDIRWGIDIQGGVEVIFTPDTEQDATDNEIDSAKLVIENRLMANNIVDSEVYPDYESNRIVVRFPWKEGEENYDPVEAIDELGETALLTFRKGNADPEGEIIVEGKNVTEAKPGYDQEELKYVVQLEFDNDGAAAFSTATEELIGDYISIYMDDICISTATVSVKIPDGRAVISGNFDVDSSQELADKINAGSLPFKLTAETYSTIDPSLGKGALNTMLIAGIIAFFLISVFMIAYYRIPGVVGCIALIGQIAGSIAAVSGFFTFIPSFTLTVPGIAGIILSIGMGVDANIIVSERIKEEVRGGKTLDGSIKGGYDLGFSAIIDGNVTVVIVALILMASFGNPSGVLATVISPIYSALGFLIKPFGLNIDAVTTGTIYSFGYTLLVGIIFNQIMGVFASKMMLTSISKIKALRNPVLYGGEKK